MKEVGDRLRKREEWTQTKFYYAVDYILAQVLGKSTILLTTPADTSSCVVDIELLRTGLRLRMALTDDEKLQVSRLEHSVWVPMGDPLLMYSACWLVARTVVNELARLVSGAPPPQVSIADHVPRLLDLSGESWQSTLHRTGWGYAMRALQPLHSKGGVKLDSFAEASFAWAPQGPVYKEPWVTFIHNPPGTPAWAQTNGTNAQLIATPRWRESQPHLRGIFVLSSRHKRFVEALGLGVPVSVLIHPTEIPRVKFSWDAFLANEDRTVIQIGSWLRNPNSLYELRCRTRRARLDTGYPWEEDTRARMKLPAVDKGNVLVIPRADDDGYDQLLSRNIVFLDLIDASANNAVIECIARHTPLLVNDHEAVREYLGDGYPLLYRDLAEAARKADDLNLLREAHEYLARLPKERFSAQHFLDSVVASEVYRRLTSTSR